MLSARSVSSLYRISQLKKNGYGPMRTSSGELWLRVFGQSAPMNDDCQTIRVLRESTGKLPFIRASSCCLRRSHHGRDSLATALPN